MSLRLLALFLIAVLASVRAMEIALPTRPAGAVKGSEFAARIAALDLTAREAAVLAEVKRGNVPQFWRTFVEVKSGTASIQVSPDYFAIGTDEDYFLCPLTPMSAQLVADQIGCVLPTRKMVDAVYRAAAVKLPPSPIPPSPAMTTAAIFSQHNTTVRDQRAATLAAHPLGALVAGHKKDVVLTPRLAVAPGKVAIYGWHQPDATAIQPLYLGHASNWVDYSHGVRFVFREMKLNDARTKVDAVLADDSNCTLLSDEGPMRDLRYGEVRAALPVYVGEKFEPLYFDPDVRVVINTPASPDPAKPTRLALFALPAGNTIEQTIGRNLSPGDDWHFDIQHIGAQTRWLRAHATDANLVVAYLECVEKSWVLWRRKGETHDRRIPEIIEALRKKFPGAKLTLTGHSAGGTFTFGYLDSVERIADDIERIAFLDSDYAYDATKSHDAKLAQWLTASSTHRLSVIAYEDYVALLDGKTFVSENGGTWGRSQAMLRDLATKFSFARSDHDGLQTHTALDGRVKFFLKENPTKAILHTRQVEWNGFIHAMLTGTPLENRGYTYLGPRVYADLIANK